MRKSSWLLMTGLAFAASGLIAGTQLHASSPGPNIGFIAWTLTGEDSTGKKEISFKSWEQGGAERLSAYRSTDECANKLETSLEDAVRSAALRSSSDLTRVRIVATHKKGDENGRAVQLHLYAIDKDGNTGENFLAFVGVGSCEVIEADVGLLLSSLD